MLRVKQELIALDTLADLVAYTGGRDVTVLWLPDGKPDVDGARRYAEGVRKQVAEQGTPLVVEQRVNRVIVSIPSAD